MPPATATARRLTRAAPAFCLVLGLAAATAAQVTRYTPTLATRAHRTTRTDPIAWLVAEATASVAVATPSAAPPRLLVAARDAFQEGTPEERAAAALVLGYGKQREDRALLVGALAGDDAGVVLRAIVGLGLLGDSAAHVRLIAMLEDREASDATKAATAFALGLEPPSDDVIGGSGYLKEYALRIMRRSRSRHAAELAACFAGFPADEGRMVLFEYLERNKVLILPGSTDHGEGEALLRGIALATLASRFATDEEWVVVRQGLDSRRSPTRRYLTAWGLYRHSGKGLVKKLGGKVAREIVKQLDDRRSAVRVMAFLALGSFDPKSALRRARAVVRGTRSRQDLLAPAFSILGRLGDKSDLDLLAAHADTALDSATAAAWCLAAADLSRRVFPKAWPHVPAGPDDEPPFPLAAIRARLGTHLAPAGLARIACAVALAKLGDRSSAFRLRELFFDATGEDARRAFALALLRLDPKALDLPSHPNADEVDPRKEWLRMLGWSYAAAPQLWTPLLARLGSAKSPAERAELLRIAGIALAGPNGDLGRRMRSRVGPAPLPAALQEIADWQRRPLAGNMGGDRRR